MIKQSNIAYGVRVKLNDNWEPKCLGDKFLQKEPVLFISTQKPYNDSKGYYVTLSSGSHMNSGYAYLDQIDLEFDPNEVLYGDTENMKLDYLLTELDRLEKKILEIDKGALIARELEKL